tara:strand:+ start:998 stop:1510 length:513 start_codon:yes stop_codon:yes gene_type:complete
MYLQQRELDPIMSIDLETFNPQKQRALRKRTYKKAYVYRDDLGGKKQCTLRNISETGALIEFSDVTNLPKNFILQVELDSFEVPSQIVRQANGYFGLLFTGPFQNIQTTRKQVLSSADSQTTALKTEEHDLKRRLYELRCSQTFNSSNTQSASQTNQFTAQTRSKGFGKR